MKLFFHNIKQIGIIIFFGANCVNFTSAQINQNLEAEGATLQGTAAIATCNNASEGQMVKGLENGSINSLVFQNISIPKAGEYFIRVSYYSVNDRNLSYQLNNGATKTNSVTTTGLWCYQGGIPGETTLQEIFAEGNNKLLFFDSPIIDKIVILSDTATRQPSAFYVSESMGNDENDGLTPENAWKSLLKANSLVLVPGDSLLFKTGDTFPGKLTFINESGTSTLPIFVSSYGSINKPVLDGNGFLSTIHILNSEYLHFSDLEICNNGGQPQAGEATNLRYGMYFENTFSDGTTLQHFRLNYLNFINIYPTIEVTDDDNTGVNAHAIITSGSWGDTIHPTRFDDMLIENCLFTRTARHATFFKSVNNLVIRNNLFEHVGGAGMVIGHACTNILVEKNITNYTGSKIDSRMAGRGSGIWCYRSKNLTVQHNKFMHAHGIHDSYGMHIDIGNRNVVYQYNYSEDNEGGFVEILGANVNVGYRYNLSVGDGWRKRGNRFGQVFWLAGWSGNPQNPVGSDSIFVYNNSIYVRDSITPGIWIESVSKNARIYNNIINVSNEFGPIVINNDAGFNDFDYNIWFGNIPVTDEDGESYRGANTMTSNPMYQDEIVTDTSGFILQAGSPAFGAGKLIYNAGISYPQDYFSNNGGIDFYGNAVSNVSPPNIGAYNGAGIGVGVLKEIHSEQTFKLFPNPVRTNQKLHIEIPTHINTQSLTIQIVDVAGRLRFEKSFKEQNIITLETNQLPRGSYIITVKSVKYLEMKPLLVF